MISCSSCGRTHPGPAEWKGDTYLCGCGVTFSYVALPAARSGIMHLTDPDPDIESAEIEVTPEMVKAGVMAFYDRDNNLMFISEEELVERIFLAMMRVKFAMPRA